MFLLTNKFFEKQTLKTCVLSLLRCSGLEVCNSFYYRYQFT